MKKVILKLLVSLMFVIPQLSLSLFGQTNLNNGNVVSVRLVESVNSRAKCVNASSQSIVVVNVYDSSNEKLLIEAGTAVLVGVTLKKAKGVGKAGKIFLNCI